MQGGLREGGLKTALYSVSAYRVMGIVLLALGASLPAGAQSVPKAEVSAGYQLLALKEGELDETFGKGWYADVAGNLGSVFSVVVQVSGNYKTLKDSNLGGRHQHGHRQPQAARVHGRHPRELTQEPDGDAVRASARGWGDRVGHRGGLGHRGGGQTLFEASESDSTTNFGMQFGGGATIWVNKKSASGARSTICSSPATTRISTPSAWRAASCSASSGETWAGGSPPPAPRCSIRPGGHRNAGEQQEGPRRRQCRSAPWCRAACRRPGASDRSTGSPSSRSATARPGSRVLGLKTNRRLVSQHRALDVRAVGEVQLDPRAGRQRSRQRRPVARRVLGRSGGRERQDQQRARQMT